MKNILNKILYGLIWCIAGIIAVLLFISNKNKGKDDVEQAKKDKYEEINSTPAADIADSTPGVRDTIREGQEEYINRIREYLSNKRGNI